MADEVVGFAPDEMSEGGGLVDDVDATLTFEFVQFDYNGTVAVPVPALHVHMVAALEGGEAEYEEYYSAGDASRLQPKEDGTGVTAMIEGAKITKDSKCGQFFKSLCDAHGSQEILLGRTNIKTLDGISVHLNRRPDKDRPGLQPAKDTKGRQRTILLVTKINAMPGAKALAKAGAAKVAPGAKPAPAGKADADVTAATIAAIEALVIEAGDDGIKKSDLSTAVFKKVKAVLKDPARIKAATTLSQSEAFLAAEGSWLYDDETGVLVAG